MKRLIIIMCLVFALFACSDDTAKQIETKRNAKPENQVDMMKDFTKKSTVKPLNDLP